MNASRFTFRSGFALRRTSFARRAAQALVSWLRYPLSAARRLDQRSHTNYPGPYLARTRIRAAGWAGPAGSGPRAPGGPSGSEYRTRREEPRRQSRGLGRLAPEPAQELQRVGPMAVCPADSE